MSTFTASLQAFFTTYLSSQRAVSPHTVAAYRDTFRILLTYLHDKTGLVPEQLQFTDLDAQTVGGFLHHLEAERRNTVRSRNARLAAIHSFFYLRLLQPPGACRPDRTRLGDQKEEHQHNGADIPH